MLLFSDKEGTLVDFSLDEKLGDNKQTETKKLYLTKSLKDAFFGVNCY